MNDDRDFGQLPQFSRSIGLLAGGDDEEPGLPDRVGGLLPPFAGLLATGLPTADRPHLDLSYLALGSLVRPGFGAPSALTSGPTSADATEDRSSASSAPAGTEEERRVYEVLRTGEDLGTAAREAVSAAATDANGGAAENGGATVPSTPDDDDVIHDSTTGTDDPDEPGSPDAGPEAATPEEFTGPVGALDSDVPSPGRLDLSDSPAEGGPGDLDLTLATVELPGDRLRTPGDGRQRGRERVGEPGTPAMGGDRARTGEELGDAGDEGLGRDRSTMGTDGPREPAGFPDHRGERPASEEAPPLTPRQATPDAFESPPGQSDAAPEADSGGPARPDRAGLWTSETPAPPWGAPGGRGRTDPGGQSRPPLTVRRAPTDGSHATGARSATSDSRSADVGARSANSGDDPDGDGPGAIPQPPSAVAADEGVSAEADPLALLESGGKRRQRFVDELYRAIERRRAIERKRGPE